MRHSFKQLILKIPLLSTVAIISKRVIKLPSDYSSNQMRLDNINNQVTIIQQLVDANSAQVEKLVSKYDRRQMVLDNIQKQLSLLQQSLESGVTKHQKKINKKELFADDHSLDVFYTNFEDKFRGSEDLIEERLKEYLPYFTQSSIDFKKHPVLDIGSGRGELLKTLKDAKINAIGLDINSDMVERANAMGLKTKQGDASEFLQNTASQTYGAITGFHIAEHLPFPVLYRTLAEIHRVLVPGGFVIFETPNPENVFVGTHNFYMDPSHLHPLPPALMEFTLETCGYNSIEIKRIHPDKTPKENSLPADLSNRFYGPRDYAVVGYK